MAELHPIVLLSRPSPEQQPAVEVLDRDVVLTAGAGTGKTRTLVARVLQLLAQDTPTRSIVAVTFTVKAAREMRNRLRSEIGRYLALPGLDPTERARWNNLLVELDAARIGTIHSLCTEILRAHPAEADVDPAFQVLDEATALQLRAEAIAEAVGWAADDVDASALFAYFTPDRLLAILDFLLANRLKAEKLFSARLWETWGGLAAAHLAAALQDDELAGAVATMFGWEQSGVLAAAAARGDALAPDVGDLLAAWRELAACRAAGDLPGALAGLPRLRSAAAGSKGKAANWGEDPKPVLRAFRSAYDARLKPLAEKVNLELDQELARLSPQLARVFVTALTRYRARKAESGALDFDDLEQQALALLAGNPDVLARWREETAALLVDEFQDTNERQRDLVQLLNGQRGRLFIVGDAKQSIYRFRGAEVDVFRAERTAIAAQGLVCNLTLSHRAHHGLLAAVNWLLAAVMGEAEIPDEPWHEPFAPLAAARPAGALGLPGPYVELHLAAGAKADGALERAAVGVVQRLRALIEASAGKWGYGDVAVLCRSSRAFAAYEDACEAAAIPYETVAGRGFLERPEVRDLLNALRALADPADDLALFGLLRSPAIGLADTDLHRLRLAGGTGAGSLWPTLCGDDAETSREAATLIRRLVGLAGRVTVADLLKQFVDATGYRAIFLQGRDGRAARNVGKLLQDAQRSGIVGVGEFLEYVQRLRVAGGREGEARADSTGAVQIMTVHQAKGLEFPVVVIGDAGGAGGGGGDFLLDERLGAIPNLEVDGCVPFVWKLAQEREARKERAETKRLLYVAATRASEWLLISGHVGVGKSGELKPGGWLKDICAALAITRAPADFDAGGSRALSLTPSIGAELPDDVKIGAVLYEPNFAVHVPAPSAAPAPEPEDSTMLPRLLASLLTDPGAADRAALPDRVWRVAPRATQRWAPAWVIGKLVHEAIAAWRDPDDPAFAAWCQARARACGLTDGPRLDDALRRTRRLLGNLRGHPLYQEMLAAEVRYHELPFAAPDEEGAQLGQIDLLFCRDDEWTLVDFKTDRVRDERARATLLSERDYVAQIERYAVSVLRLLGVRPRCVLCLLDDRGAASAIPVGDAAAGLPAAVVQPEDAAWEQALELTDARCRPLLLAVRGAGLPAPEVGLDIVDGRGRVVATAELAWPARRLAVFLPGQELELSAAGRVGWRTVLAEDASQSAAAVVAAWRQETI